MSGVTRLTIGRVVYCFSSTSAPRNHFQMVMFRSGRRRTMISILIDFPVTTA